MRFSIVIPTQDRAKLLEIAVRHAMRLDHPDFEVVVSDNSTSDEMRSLNLDAVRDYGGSPNFKLIRPARVLSPPEHFESALGFAKGDYVVYLTDKMVVLPSALSDAEAVIRASRADIVNWAGATYYVDDPKYPSGSGTLVEELEFLRGRPQPYDPRAALRFKASCVVPRDSNKTRTSDYVAGKIVFGCYSRDLVDRILATSGTVFGGATHDYSAMVQALSLARTCVLLKTYGIVFISLPRDQSLGTLTATEPQRALQYFRSFTDADSILASLLVPGLYASQHNMVAHDYKKFLPMYNNKHLFNETNWLSAIYSDLSAESKVWLDSAEQRAQFDLFNRFVNQAGQRFQLKRRRLETRLAEKFERLSQALVAQVYGRILRKQQEPSTRTFAASSLNEAIQHVLSRRFETSASEVGCG